MYSWPEPAACAAAPSVTWDADKNDNINKDLRQIQMFAAARVGGNVIKNTACRSGKEREYWGNWNVSHVAFLQLGDLPLQLLVVCVAGRHPSGHRWPLRKGRTLQEKEKQHVIGSKTSPALQTIDVLLLLLPALLGRLLITNFSAYFLQNPLFALMEGRRCQRDGGCYWCCYWWRATFVRGSWLGRVTPSFANSFFSSSLRISSCTDCWEVCGAC